MRSFVVVCGLAAALTLTGCSGEATPPAGTTEAKPAAIDSVTGLATAVDKAVAEKKSATFTLQSEGAQKVTGTGAYLQQGDVLGLTVTMTADGAEIGITAVDNTVYLKIAGLAEEQPGKTWVKIDPAGQDPISKAFAPMVGSFRDNVQLSKALEAAQGAATIKETRPDNGGTYYKLLIDTKKAADTVTNPVLKEQIALDLKAGLTELTWEVWLDKDNLPLKVIEQSSEDGKPATQTMVFKDWGKPVEIKAPPADQIGTVPTG